MYVGLGDFFFLYITSCFCTVNHTCSFITQPFVVMKSLCSCNGEGGRLGPKNQTAFRCTGLVSVVWSRERQEQDQQRCTRGKEGWLFEAEISSKKQ